MKRHLYGIIIVFLLVMPTLKADITTLEEAIELIKHLEDHKEYNATALNELKDYILNDDSLTQDEIEILFEKVADLDAESATDGSPADGSMVETRKKLKSKRFRCVSLEIYRM